MRAPKSIVRSPTCASDLGTADPAHRTGSGGLHIYMRLPENAGRLKGNLAADGYSGVDLKFIGGQVVAPGSIEVRA